MIQLWLVSTLDDVVKKDIIWRVAAVFRPSWFVGDEKRREDMQHARPDEYDDTQNSKNNNNNVCYYYLLLF